LWFRKLIDPRREILEAIAEARGISFDAVIDELGRYLIAELAAEYRRRGWPLPLRHRTRRRRGYPPQSPGRA